MMACASRAESYQALMSVWDEPARFLSGTRPRSATDPLRAALDASPDPLALDEMLLLDQRYYLPDDLLQKVDRASMAVSLEVRVPLLDHRVVEESWRLGNEFKLRAETPKWALREILYRRVPRELVERPKTGFSVPVDQWLAGPLREWSEDLLLSHAPARDVLLDPTALRSSWASFVGGRTELALGIWSLVMFEAWRRQWSADNVSEVAACVS